MLIYVLSVAAFTLQGRAAYCDKDSMALKLKNMYYLTLYLKSLLIPDLEFKGSLLVLTVEDRVRVL